MVLKVVGDDFASVRILWVPSRWLLDVVNRHFAFGLYPGHTTF